MSLNLRQIRFCEEYLIDFNATQAAIRAGYSKKTSGQIGEQNLRKLEIQEFIQSVRKKDAEKKALNREMVIEAYRKLAFYDSRKFYDEDGNLLPVPSLDDETAYALAGFEVLEEKVMGIPVGATKKIKTSDRRAALDSICKVLGYNEPDKSEVLLKQPFTDSQVESIINAIRGK